MDAALSDDAKCTKLQYMHDFVNLQLPASSARLSHRSGYNALQVNSAFMSFLCSLLLCTSMNTDSLHKQINLALSVFCSLRTTAFVEISVYWILCSEVVLRVAGRRFEQHVDTNFFPHGSVQQRRTSFSTWLPDDFSLC